MKRKRVGKRGKRSWGVVALDKCGPLHAQWEHPGFICLCDIFPDPIKSLTTGLKCDLYFWFFIENI